MLVACLIREESQDKISLLGRESTEGERKNISLERGHRPRMTPHEKGNENGQVQSDDIFDPDESRLMFRLNDDPIEIINTSSHQK